MSTDLPVSPTSLDNEKIIFNVETLYDEEISLDSDSVSYKAVPSSDSSSCGSSTSSVSFLDFDVDPEKKKVSLPAMEIVIRNLGIIQQRLLTKEPVKSKQKDEKVAVNYSVETPVDIEMYTSSLSQTVDIKNVPVNQLGPREQEEADEPMRRGMKYFDPLYSLGLGAMTFIKAMMTYNPDDIKLAMDTLTITCNIAKSQVDNATMKEPKKRSFTSYFSTLSTSNHTGLPANPPIQKHSEGDGPRYLSNGVLRANVVKAESCLLMGMLQMTQESVVGYLKCGLNLRRAYNCYTIVWQEYKRMGQAFTRYMDRDTVSAVQFGIGTVHLLLSSLPPKILKIFSTLGFKSDKQLGFALLKLCLEGRGIRSPLASLVLLTYYSILSSFAPQIYAKELMGPAVECLLDAQKNHPSSCFFLFYAGRISRVARNLPLSTQSFTFAVESCQGEWAENAMSQISNYEMGFNAALQLDWITAETYFQKLSQEQCYWSPAFCQYFIGACRGMLGRRTESILAFAEVPQLAKDQTNKSYIDTYVQQKVEFFQRTGYQDMDFSLPGLELLLVWNMFEQMSSPALEGCLLIVQSTLQLIYEREKLDYNIRVTELVPTKNPPDYYDQRAILLLIKASALNALKRHQESIAHLNWIMDHKHHLKSETWIIPFTYWESGVTSWGLGDFAKSRKVWELALACTKYTFEYRMAVRLSLALSKCDEVGVTVIQSKKQKGVSSNGRKRMPVAVPS
ncbi:hypothetical protein HPULCUR_001121 [Helicostylum pulchrum]|uniref:Tetratricopeptide repeat protein 39C n=1 Tax=Helicostylum pulchrum TaxID=562976 RepID=A0ABP9XLT7_9FUNG